MMGGGIRGFVLQPTYRVERQEPVVHLWGRLEGGDSFLARDRRPRPFFFIRRRDEDEARRLGARRIVAGSWRDFSGLSVSKIELGLPAEVPTLRDRLHRAGLITYEADVRYATRYLMDRGIRGSIEIEGPWERGDGVDRVYENPEISAASWIPSLRVTALDIETDYRNGRLLSVALFGAGACEVIVVDRRRREAQGPCVIVADESELLHTLGRRVRAIDPDVLTGWNVVSFDLHMLAQCAERRNVPLILGRSSEPLRIRAVGDRGSIRRATIPGRLVLDGPEVLRTAFVRFERQSLEHVAQRVLGEGKTLRGEDRAAEILRLYESDLDAFIEYNLTDSRLALQILERMELIELAVARSRLTGVPVDRVGSSIASFDFLYLSELHERARVAPTTMPPADATQSFAGGQVFAPRAGLHRNVVVLDFKSLYPSIIRTFQIDPLGFEADPDADGDYIVSPSGAAFQRGKGLAGKILDRLSRQRERAGERGREVESKAIKILMNSFYGVLGAPNCRFYNPAIAAAITSFGRAILVWSRDRVRSWGHEVLYGDTDSLFVSSGRSTVSEAAALGLQLAQRLNRSLADYVRQEWRVESRLESEFEDLYLRLFVPAVRHGRGAARKRYAGLVARGEGTEVVFTGLEAVRSDWTRLARGTQRELYRRLFFDEPVEEFLARVIEEVLQGDRDDELVYQKRLRKPLEAYTSTTPPHVVAARRMSTRPGRTIRYVMTTSGPEPVDERVGRIDYQHYVDRQLRPVAEPVLAHLGLEFSKISGEDRQLDLF